jgi:Bifunctional DNA primase/polymerase, N-terminal
MENVPNTGTSGNTSPNPDRLSEVHQGSELSKAPPGPAPDSDTGYPVLQPQETDPNPDRPPPVLKNDEQAALHALSRGFDDLIALQANGTPADPDWRCRAMNSAADVHARWAREPRRKVGAATGRVVIVAIGDESPDLRDKLSALRAQKTAAVRSALNMETLFFFRLSPGVRSVETELAPGVEVLAEEYVMLPSGTPTDTCYWINHRKIAPAPQWLLDRATVAASQPQTEEGIDAVSADTDASEMFRNPSNMPPPAIVQGDPMAEEWIESADEEEDKDDAAQHEPPTTQDTHDAFNDAQAAGEEDTPSEIEKDMSEIEESAAGAPSIAPASPPKPTDARQPLTKKDFALDYARRGFRVFPITPNAKNPPLITYWPVGASADPHRSNNGGNVGRTPTSACQWTIWRSLMLTCASATRKRGLLGTISTCRKRTERLA